MKRRKVVDKTLGFHWYMQFGGTEESAGDWFCGKFDVETPPSSPNNNGCIITCSKQKYAALIWIRGDCGASIMAHEIAHAVMHVCRVLDLDPREADEFQASYAGYLMLNLNEIAT